MNGDSCRGKVNNHSALAGNSLFFDNREIDHRKQRISIFETAICFRVSEKSANPGWVHMLAAHRDAKFVISILAGDCGLGTRGRLHRLGRCATNLILAGQQPSPPGLRLHRRAWSLAGQPLTSERRFFIDWLRACRPTHRQTKVPTSTSGRRTSIPKWAGH